MIASAKSGSADETSSHPVAYPPIKRSTRFLETFTTVRSALQLIGLSALICLIASNNPAPMSLGMQLTMTFAGTLLVWWSAAFLILCTYLASSGASFSSLFNAAVRASIPTVWFIPVYLLLSTPNVASSAIGVLLAASATHLLVSRRLSNRRIRVNKPPKQEDILFQSAPVSNRGILPVLFGSLILEISLSALLAGQPVAALLLACATAAIWTWSSIARGDYRPPVTPANWPHFAWSVLFAVLILTSLPEVNRRLGISEETTNLAGSQGVPLEPNPKESVAPAKKLAIPSKNGIPGVILRPKGMAPQRMTVALKPTHAQVFLGKALKFPFTGEYHLYAASSKRPQFDSAVVEGTPLDAAYSTLDSGYLVTEAVQALYPPMNFADCEKIQVSLLSKDGGVGIVGMQLLAPGAVRDLGTDLLGLKQRGAEETLEFAIPAAIRGFEAHAIRLVFDRGPKERHISSRVAVRSFALIPREDP